MQLWRWFFSWRSKFYELYALTSILEYCTMPYPAESPWPFGRDWQPLVVNTQRVDRSSRSAPPRVDAPRERQLYTSTLHINSNHQVIQRSLVVNSNCFIKQHGQHPGPKKLTSTPPINSKRQVYTSTLPVNSSSPKRSLSSVHQVYFDSAALPINPTHACEFLSGLRLLLVFSRSRMLATLMQFCSWAGHGTLI